MWCATIVLTIVCSADVDVALKDLNSSDLTIRQAAYNTLLNVAQNGSDMVQQQLLEELLKLKDQKLESFVLELMNAIAVSNPSAFKSSIKDLQNWFDNATDVRTQVQILVIVGILGKEASAFLPTVQEFANRNQQHDVFVEAWALFAKLRLTYGEEGREELADFVKSDDPQQRWMAATIIGAMVHRGDQQFASYLKKLIDDKHVTVRVCAASAMLRMDENDTAVNVLRQSLNLPREKYRTTPIVFGEANSLGHKVAAVTALSCTTHFRELAPDLCEMFGDDDILLHQVLAREILAHAGDSPEVLKKLDVIIPTLNDENGRAYAQELAKRMRRSGTGN